jgi:hypothetical protein
MLHSLHSKEAGMPISESGRIVIEVDTDLKRDLYAALEREQLTLKKWFIQRASNYVANAVQPSLALSIDLKGKETKS